MRRAGGFTLVELMVVVAIVGIMSTAAAVMVSGDPDLGTVGSRIGAQMSEAARKAVAGGPVRPGVVTSEGFTARARLYVGSDSGEQFVSVDVRVEDEPETATTSSWKEVSRFYLPRGAEVYGYEIDYVRLEPGGDPTELGGDSITVECEPNGSCQRTTLYLRELGAGGDRKRIVIMPLGSAPLVLDDW